MLGIFYLVNIFIKGVGGDYNYFLNLKTVVHPKKCEFYEN
jgi:hypothetical protein